MWWLVRILYELVSYSLIDFVFFVLVDGIARSPLKEARWKARLSIHLFGDGAVNNYIQYRHNDSNIFRTSLQPKLNADHFPINPLRCADVCLSPQFLTCCNRGTQPVPKDCAMGPRTDIDSGCAIDLRCILCSVTTISYLLMSQNMVSGFCVTSQTPLVFKDEYVVSFNFFAFFGKVLIVIPNLEAKICINESGFQRVMVSVLRFQPEIARAVSSAGPGAVMASSATYTTGHLSNISTEGGITFAPEPSVISDPVCEWILYDDIAESRVRIWDLIILIPNSVFMMFLLWNLRMTITKLKQTNSPIFTAFYVLVCMVSVISVLRCIVGMTVNASVLSGDIADKVLWLVLRFFLLATELSVVVFGLAFGHLDSKTSIRRVLLITSTSAFIYSCTQGSLEFMYPDPKFHIEKGALTKNYDIFAHGGMIFWMTSSAFFFIIYSVICILPWTHLKEKWNLPSKKSFYYYALFLAILNCAQTVGSALLYSGFLDGMCVVDTTTYIYFTAFHPLVYGTFLWDFFKLPPQNIPFSYKYQLDEGQDEDTVSLPSQARDKYPADNGSDSGSFDSTHFDRQSGYISGSVNADVYVQPRSYQNS